MAFLKHFISGQNSENLNRVLNLTPATQIIKLKSRDKLISPQFQLFELKMAENQLQIVDEVYL
jgi:hypothetical protein